MKSKLDRRSLTECIAVIEERDEQGRPYKLRLLRPDDVVDVREENDFMRVWVDPKMLQKGN